MRKLFAGLVVLALFAMPALAQIEVGPRVIWGPNYLTSLSPDVKLVIGDFTVSGYAEGAVLNAVGGLTLASLGEGQFGAGLKLLGGAAFDPNAIPAERVAWQFGAGADVLIGSIGARVYSDHLFKFKPGGIEYIPSVGISFDVLDVLKRVLKGRQ